ncbi:MAG: heparinase II/III family protein [Thermoguttaceae bacterium]
MRCKVAFVGVAVAVLFTHLAIAESEFAPSAERIAQWAAMLPATPRGVGPTIEDRATWQSLARLPGIQAVVRQAERLRTEPIPEISEELFLEFSRNGNRTHCERVMNQHTERLGRLVVAECVENKGRFLQAVAEAARALCREKTWLPPAHDRNLKNYRGQAVTLDLRSTAVAWNLATARYWLGDKLPPEIRTLIRDELQRRTFEPFRKTVRDDGRKGLWRVHWLVVNNNWNAVCLAGVAGAALATVESIEDRAFFAAAVEKNVRPFLDGFTADGYCSEGMDYWNYGFGRYVMLAETLRQASRGRVDLLDQAKVTQIARFARRMEIVSGVYPAFADCNPAARPDPRIVAAIDRHDGTERNDVGVATLGRDSHLFSLALLDFPCATPKASAAKKPAVQPPRDWFPKAGVLVCRPGDLLHGLGVAMKGGHNAENHNHNDLGSFVVALDHSALIVDPGNEIYTGRTFGPHRYESNVLNSFGHGVPRVAGRLQTEGRSSAARVVKTEFTPKTDTLVLDLASAYRVKELRKLERTFVFSREGRGSLTVSDAVEFSAPQTFGTAIVTFDRWRSLRPDRLQIGEGDSSITATIEAVRGQFSITPETIHEQLPGGRAPVRLGVDLKRPATSATIRIRIAPEKPSEER